MSFNHVDIFTNIYETCEWGTNKNAEYNGSSGDGAAVEDVIDTYVPFVKSFIKEHDIKTVVDLGCGDFRAGKYIYDDLEVKYTGYDAYEKVVKYNTKAHTDDKYKFIHLDFFNKKEEIVPADLCIIKHVLQHWSIYEIIEFMDYIVNKKIFKYILINNCSFQTGDNMHFNVARIDNKHLWMPLSAKFFPLSKYNPKVLYTYSSKEVSVIT